MELTHVQDVETARDVFPHGFIVLQAVARLVDKSHLHGLADLDFAGIRLLTARNHLEQGRLARAIGADDADDGTGRNLETQVVDQHTVTKGLGDAHKLDHLLAQAVGHRNEDLVGLIALLVFKVAELLKARQTGFALGLAGLGVLAGPLQLLLQGLGARLFAFLLGLQARLLLAQPVAVVAFVRNAGAAVEFQNPLGGVVQKVAVMGDRYHGPGVALQKLLQPVHRFGVQVVGRFVQQQHVRLGEQQLAQGHAALLATREHANLGIPGRQAQSVGGNFELVLGIGPGRGDDGFQIRLLGGQRVKVGVLLGVGGVHLLEAGFGGKHLAHAGLHALAHRVAVVELGLLRQVADLQTGHGNGFALNLGVYAGHDLQQRGLARPVGTQHANLGTGEEAERNVFEDVAFGRHDLADPIHGENVLSHCVWWRCGR